MSPPVEGHGGDALAVDHRAVGRAEVGQHHLGAVEVEPGVPARDADVGQAQVGLVAAADHGRADRQRVGAPVAGHQPHVAAPARRDPAAARLAAGSRPGPDRWYGSAWYGCGRHVAAGVDLGRDPEHAGVEPSPRSISTMTSPYTVQRLLADELGLRLGQLLGQRGGVRRQPAVVVRRQVDHVAVRHQRAPTGEDGLVRLRLPLHGVEDLHGVDDPLEHLGEGPLDQAFQALLEALQHAHRLLLGFRGHDGIRPTALRYRTPDGQPRATLTGASAAHGSRASRSRRSSGVLRIARAAQRSLGRQQQCYDKMPQSSSTGKWRNGRRARFRSVCPKGRGGSTPPFPTTVSPRGLPSRATRQ